MLTGVSSWRYFSLAESPSPSLRTDRGDASAHNEGHASHAQYIKQCAAMIVMDRFSHWYLDRPLSRSVSLPDVRTVPATRPSSFTSSHQTTEGTNEMSSREANTHATPVCQSLPTLPESCFSGTSAPSSAHRPSSPS
ncbi:unnamed protein product [Vitrella brassicaformis CCMP3155]|uniref:Uncharacterized protein n=1 Tax=Vitrella brassicaformis (strain CCMP3155) TaxID=1169540 RepID=A0A0G4G9Q2_VITBC|nr:unnamed protein product [Vitrella brassicaformis CCMP3155]|eukprot:CEM25651.1 unnamed protein product [Vitrella brassicaformis CCMP3155]